MKGCINQKGCDYDQRNIARLHVFNSKGHMLMLCLMVLLWKLAIHGYTLSIKNMDIDTIKDDHIVLQFM